MLARQDLGGIPDAGVLRHTRNGLLIVRRMKHEPISIEGLTRDRLAVRTNKYYGSKFDPAWTLERLVDWVEQQVDAAGWSAGPDAIRTMDIPLNETAGISAGVEVHTIRVVQRGVNVHAYPVEDAP